MSEWPMDDGRVPSEPGSREPSPAGSAASGFDPSRVRGWLAAMAKQGEDRIWRGAEKALLYFDLLIADNEKLRREADFLLHVSTVAPTQPGQADEQMNRQEVEDFLSDAISESLGPDWSARDGAKHILMEMEREALSLVAMARPLSPAQEGITAADRRAAKEMAKVGIWSPAYPDLIMQGQYDGHPIVKAFSRHRICGHLPTPMEAAHSDSDGSPEGRDGEAGSVRSTTARAEGIAQILPTPPKADS